MPTRPLRGQPEGLPCTERVALAQRINIRRLSRISRLKSWLRSDRCWRPRRVEGIMILFRRDKSLPQFVEVRSSGLAHQPEGLPCIEQAALAQRIVAGIRAEWELLRN